MLLNSKYLHVQIMIDIVEKSAEKSESWEIILFLLLWHLKCCHLKTNLLKDKNKFIRWIRHILSRVCAMRIWCAPYSWHPYWVSLVVTRNKKLIYCVYSRTAPSVILVFILQLYKPVLNDMSDEDTSFTC